MTKLTGVTLPPRPMAKRGRVSSTMRFEETRFEAKLHEVKFLPSGECRIVLLAPEEYSDQAGALKGAFPCALEIDVKKMSYGK